MNKRANERELSAKQFEQLQTEYINTIVDSMSMEDLQDKLYYNLYNPKDGVGQTTTELPDLNIDLSKLNNVHSMKDYSN